jgi:hypothetical protein
MTRVASKIIYVHFYDSHTLSLHIVATSLKRHLKREVSLKRYSAELKLVYLGNMEKESYEL